MTIIAIIIMSAVTVIARAFVATWMVEHGSGLVKRYPNLKVKILIGLLALLAFMAIVELVA